MDALNNGFKMCTGEILAWLNSDDTMNRNTVSMAVAALDRTGADLVYGDVDIVDEHGKFLRISRGVPFDFRILLCGINYIGQQTVFFRRNCWSGRGLFVWSSTTGSIASCGCGWRNTGNWCTHLKSAHRYESTPPRNPWLKGCESGQRQAYPRRVLGARRSTRSPENAALVLGDKRLLPRQAEMAGAKSNWHLYRLK